MGEYVTRTEADRLAPPASEFPGAGSYIVAVLLPIAGVVLGIVALAKGRTGPGLALIAASALVFSVWLFVLG